MPLIRASEPRNAEAMPCEQNRRLKWKPIVMLLKFEPSFVQESALVALSTFAFLPKLAWQTRWTVILELEVGN